MKEIMDIVPFKKDCTKCIHLFNCVTHLTESGNCGGKTEGTILHRQNGIMQNNNKNIIIIKNLERCQSKDIMSKGV